MSERHQGMGGLPRFRVLGAKMGLRGDGAEWRGGAEAGEGAVTRAQAPVPGRAVRTL